MQVVDDQIEVQTNPADLESVRQTLETGGIDIDNVDFAMVPQATIPLEPKTALQALRLLDALEELDDVMRVYSNAEFTDEVLASYAE